MALLDQILSSEEAAQRAIESLLAERRANQARDWQADESFAEQPPRPTDFSLRWSTPDELHDLGIPAPTIPQNEISADQRPP